MVSRTALEAAIWRIAPAWIGGPTSDVEVRQLMIYARKVERALYDNYHKVTASELAAAVIHEYFNS